MSLISNSQEYLKGEIYDKNDIKALGSLKFAKHPAPKLNNITNTSLTVIAFLSTSKIQPKKNPRDDPEIAYNIKTLIQVTIWENDLLSTSMK